MVVNFSGDGTMYRRRRHVLGGGATGPTPTMLGGETQLRELTESCEIRRWNLQLPSARHAS